MAIKSYWPQKQGRAKASNRDFGRRRFGNPLFRPPTSRGASWHRRQNHQRDWQIPWPLIMLAVLVVGIGYGFWYLLWSEAFRIKDVRVEGASPEVEIAIRNCVNDRLAHRDLFVFPQSNLLIFAISATKQEIQSKVYLQSLSVSKKLPSTVTVTVVEKEPKVVVAAANKLAVADAEGVMVRELTEGERIKLGELPPALKDSAAHGSDTLAINSRDLVEAPADGPKPANSFTTHDDTEVASAPVSAGLPWPLVVLDEQRHEGLPSKEYAVGVKTLPPEAVKTVLEAGQLFEGLVKAKVKWYTSRPVAETIEIMTSEGWSAYVSTAKPIQDQLRYLREVLAKAVGPRRSELLYVDVRYNEKIFVKFQDKIEPNKAPAKQGE
jgi:cell division septal protein FtsQ